MNTRKSIVIFGGGFNPPLNSHFSIAQQVINQYQEVEKVIFIPVNDNYPKEGLIQIKHRYNMLKAVADKNDNFVVSDMDMYGKKSLPTIEVVEQIQNQLKNKEIWILMGSDNLKEIHTWDKAEELVGQHKFLIMIRDEDKMEEIINNNNLLKKYKENFTELKQEIRSNFSSTYVRAQLKNNKSIRYLVPDDVYEYIEKNKLYRSE